MKKKVLTIIIAVFFAFLLCGCSANVGYSFSYVPNEDGTYGIEQTFTVVVDKVSITAAGKTPDDFYEKFQSLGNGYISILKSSFSYQCEKEHDQEIEAGYSQKVKNLGGEEATVQKLFDYVTIHMLPVKFESGQNDEYYAVSLTQKFDTVLAYKCFWGMLNTESDGTDANDGEVVDETFYRKTIYVQNTVFNGLTEENYENLGAETKHIITEIKEFFNNAYNLDNKNLTYTFSFATPQNHFYTDSDYMETDEYGNAVYTWEFSSQDLKTENGDQITTWTIAYRTSNWYLLAIYLTIILGVILLLVAIIKEKSKKKTE